MAASTVRVHGYQGLNLAFARAPDRLKREYRQRQRSLAEPVRRAAESRSLTEIRNMDSSPEWGRMRTGITTRVVYVAPKQRSRGGRGRKNLARLLLDRAMIPALDQHQARTVREFEGMLATMGRDWER